jgi:hypothetical protein
MVTHGRSITGKTAVGIKHRAHQGSSLSFLSGIHFFIFSGWMFTVLNVMLGGELLSRRVDLTQMTCKPS